MSNSDLTDITCLWHEYTLVTLEELNYQLVQISSGHRKQK